MVSNNPELSKHPFSFSTERENISRATSSIREVGEALREFHQLMRSVHDARWLTIEEHRRSSHEPEFSGATLAELKSAEKRLLQECRELISQKAALQERELTLAAAVSCSKETFSTSGSGKQFAERAVALCRIPADMEDCQKRIEEKIEEIGRLRPLMKERFLVEHGHYTERILNQSIRKASDRVEDARGIFGLGALFAPAALRAARAQLASLRAQKDSYRAYNSHSPEDEIKGHPVFSMKLEQDNEKRLRGALAEVSGTLCAEMRSSLKAFSPSHIAKRIQRQRSEAGSPSSGEMLRNLLTERLLSKPSYGRSKDSEKLQAAALALVDSILVDTEVAHPRQSSDSSSHQRAAENNFAAAVGSKPHECLKVTGHALRRLALGELLVPATESLQALLSAGQNDLSWTAKGEVEAIMRSLHILPPDHVPRLYYDLLSGPRIVPLAQATFRGRDGSPVGLSPASLSQVHMEIADAAVSEILVSEEHRDETVHLGNIFLRYCDPAHHAPFLLLNSVRETGFSGEFPFISRYFSQEPSILVEKLLSIPEEQVEAMRDFPCPSLYAAISLLREHGQEVFRPSDNPLGEPFWRHIEQLALHYIQHGSPAERQFGVTVLGRLRVDIGAETFEILRDLVDKDSPEALDRQLLRILETRKTYSQTWPAEICLRLMEKAACPQSHWNRWQDSDKVLETLFWTLRPETIENPNVRTRLARCLSVSADEISRSLDALAWLSKIGLLESKELKGSEGFENKASDLFNVNRCWRLLEWTHVARFCQVPNLPGTIERHAFTAGRSLEESLALTGIIVEAILSSERPELFTAKSFDDTCRTIVKMCDAQRNANVLDADGSGSATWLDPMARLIADAARQGRSLTHISDAIERSLIPLSSAAQAAKSCSHGSYDPSLLFSEKSLPALLSLFPAGRDHSGLSQSGFSLLARTGWLTEETLPLLAEMLPVFSREGANSLDAWQSHAANIEHGKAAFLTADDFSLRGELQTLLEFQRHFYALPAPTLYRAFRAIGHPERTEDLREFGLKHADTRVINELKSRIASIRDQLLSSEAAIPIESELDEELLSAFIGYGAGSHDMSAAAREFNSSALKGRVEPRDPRFFDKTFTVECLDADKIRAFSFSEPTANRYKLFVGDLQAVRGKTLNQVVDSEHELASRRLSAEHAAISSALASGAEMTPAQRSGREQELARIGGLMRKLNEDRSILGLMDALSEFRQKENPVSSPSLRRISLRLGLDQLSNEGAFFALLSSTPSKEALESVVALVNTNLKNEALTQPAFRSLTQQQRTSIQVAVGTLPFQEDLKKLNSIGTAGTEKILVHPTRGLLGELSGYNCSACWTREQDIMARYPNATALMFVRDPENESRKRVVGACILLKVKDIEGNDTFVVRGLNPTQNFITTLKPDSFFERFIDDVVVPYAQAQGVATIVIPNDSFSGGAQTNRPSLAAYIGPAYRDKGLVHLDPNGPTSRFNNYDITESCVLLRDVASGASRAENS